MDEERIPLFGWLPQCRLAHGTTMRWRDRVRLDMKRFSIEEKRLYMTAQDRGSWRGQCRAGLEDATEKG